MTSPDPAEPSPTLRHHIEYVALRAFAAVVWVLGYHVGSVIARALARLYCLVDRKRVRIAEQNLRDRLGVDAATARRMARASFRHLFLSAVEIVQFDRHIARRGLDDIVTVENAEVMEAALAAGKGVILCTGHLGNWEVVARVCMVRGWKISTIYRPLDNPLLDRWIVQYRRAHGQEMTSKRGATRTILRTLRDGGICVLLVDQDARKHGVMVPFIGRDASTIRTPAELALRTGAAIITGFTARTGPGFRHVARVDPPLPLDPTGDHDADVLRIMTEINRRLEAALRRTPEQWLWSHRRWKSALAPGEDGRVRGRGPGDAAGPSA